ncbi:MAG TPA: hypothetical protein VFZ27_10570 [Terriglobia bacterium]|nr:hypothetical protein [Terriglobia bacterium]
MGGYLYVDNANPTLSHSATFTYDGVKRLATATATPFGSRTVSYIQRYNYDPCGNMSCMPGSSGFCPIVSYIASSNHIN